MPTLYRRLNPVVCQHVRKIATKEYSLATAIVLICVDHRQQRITEKHVKYLFGFLNCCYGGDNLRQLYKATLNAVYAPVYITNYCDTDT